MSFDVYFLNRPADDDWDSAMTALADADGQELILTSERLELWNNVANELRRLLPDAEVFESERVRELTDEGSGIQVSLFPGELVLSVPYWHSGDEADQMVELLRQLARAIEAASGLVAYDPQASAPFIGDGDATATSSFDLVHRSLAGPREENSDDGTAQQSRSRWRRFFGS